MILGRGLQGLAQQPGGTELLAEQLRRQQELTRRWHVVHDLLGDRHVSRKSQDLLRRRGLGPALLDGGMGLTPDKVYDGVDILKVLLVRISFETNRNPSLTTIAADGDFDLEPLAEPDVLAIDPPPHNKAFFAKHLEGLAEFYQYQSGRRLYVDEDIRVLPPGDEDSYKLSDVADYGPGADGGWTLAGLERLVRDMMVAADEGTQADGSVDMSDYDDDNDFTYIIFVHSGSDWQSDIKGDSPNDIPTFFVTLGEAQELPSSGGMLSECSVIPETTNQDDLAGSIAAALYHEFGHALGLVDIYDTSTGLTQVGVWDLMDAGTNLGIFLGEDTNGDNIADRTVYAIGVLPPSLAAWNKWFLGWAQVGEITGDETEYRLPAIEVLPEDYDFFFPGQGFTAESPQILRGGVSPREFFLLENRWVPSVYELENGLLPYDELFFERDEDTQVILYLAGHKPEDPYEITENSGLYDYLLPAGGVLVWHVNMDRVQAGLSDNTINYFGDALRLVEADGIQDIGVLDAYVLGWYGSELDPFGNESGYFDLYCSGGAPSSRCFDRSWSGLELHDIRQQDEHHGRIMTFTGGIVPVIAGYPWEMPPLSEAEATTMGGGPGPRAINPKSLTPVTVGGDPVLIMADFPYGGWVADDYPATLFGLRSDGSARWTAPDGKPEGSFLELGSHLVAPPLVLGETGEDVQLVYTCYDGTVGLVDLPASDDPSAVPSVAWTYDLFADFGFSTPVAAVDPTGVQHLFIVLPAGALVRVDAEGVQESFDLASLGYETDIELMGPPRVLPVVEDGDLLALFSDTGLYILHVGNGGALSSRSFLPFPREAHSVGDGQAAVPVSGGFILHFFDREGQLASWEIDTSGSLVGSGPEIVVDGGLVAEPAVADLDGDGGHDLILATASRIHAFQANGIKLRGFPAQLYELFPLPETTRIVGPLIVADGTGDGVNEVYFNTDGGHLLGLDALGGLLAQTPLLWGGHMEMAMAVGPASDDENERTLWLVSAGGKTDPLLDRQPVNGRVTGYRLAKEALPRNRTSEWLGVSGGVLRSGPQGDAKALSGLALVSRDVDGAILYPNPLRTEELTVRFYSHGARAAHFWLYSLEGEEIHHVEIPVVAGSVNEEHISLPDLASGLYIGRLQRETTSGYEIKMITLAVER